MKLRPSWIAAPACAAAGLVCVNIVGAQESKGVRPDTTAATRMFGPPPTKPGQEPQAPVFFPNAQPPRNDLPPPRITVESSLPPEPQPLPLKPAAAAMPIISTPAVPSGPQPLVPSIAPQALPVSVSQMMPFPAMQLMAKHAPSLTIEVLMPESVSVGASLDYTLVVKNTGTSAVANVRIDDEVPLGSKFVMSEPLAEQGNDRLSWSLGTLEPGSEKRIRVSVKPGDEGELKSRAMASFTAAAEAKVKVTRPRISVQLVGTESARVGDEVPFQIKVTNTGSGTASNVLVKAKLSEGLHHPAGGQIEAIIDKLPAGESKVITLRAMAVKGGGNGCAITATGDGIAAEVANASVSVVEPMLAAKVAGPARCNVRSEPEYRIELSNPGSAPTDAVQVWAVLPDGFEFVGASDGGSYNASNRTVVWNTASLAAGGNRSVGVRLKAASACEGTIKVVAQTNPNGDIVGVSTSGRSATRILEVKAEQAVKSEGVPALRFEVVDIEDPVEVGKEALYDIKIVNTGTAPCTNVTMNVFLADGTVVAGATGPTTARGQGQQIAFDVMPTLAAKGEAVYRVRVKGLQPGDMKLKVQLACDEIRTPTAKEENTRFFKD